MATSYSLFRTTDTNDSAAPSAEGVAASGTSAYYSKPWAANNRSWGLHVQTTGTLTGTFLLQASDKAHPILTTDADWVDTSTHADFVETNPSGSTTNWRINSTLIKATWLRLKYTNATGTGNLIADVTAETAL